MASFLPPHIYLGSWQTTKFGEKKLETIGCSPLLSANAILPYFLKMKAMLPKNKINWKITQSNGKNRNTPNLIQSSPLSVGRAEPSPQL